MNILIIGGYGVFGSRLAKLLIQDGHDVCIAGRTKTAAETCAKELGCSAKQMDRNQDLSEIAKHDVVIDAAGPFHDYGDDPYKVAKAAIECGTHYLDLSENAAFCAGITELDADARKAGVCVISGISSVPALSSAAIRALAGDETPDLIDSAILPGNKSPRGLSVMASILTQAGQPMQVWRDGRWANEYGWSDPQQYLLPDGLTRQGWQIEVPDQSLLPEHFGAKNVLFRAGLELGIMRYGLAAFARVRRIIPFRISKPLLKAFKLAADMLAPFGTSAGGMSVMVQIGQEQRFWRLLVTDGDGPFIPGVAARALLRRAELPIGARPAIEVITLSEAEQAMADLSVKVEQKTQTAIPIFEKVLGPDFAKLPAEIKATHQTIGRSHWKGTARVERGSGPWNRVIAALFGFPPASDSHAVKLMKTVTATGEKWERDFSGRVFRSALRDTPHGMTERFGPFTFLLGLNVKDGALFYPVKSGRLGPIPLPKWFLPLSEAREFVEEGVFHFDVRLYAPLTKTLLVRYQGRLERDP